MGDVGDDDLAVGSQVGTLKAKRTWVCVIVDVNSHRAIAQRAMISESDRVL